VDETTNQRVGGEIALIALFGTCAALFNPRIERKVSGQRGSVIRKR
jgi:hypothetical protein